MKLFNFFFFITILFYSDLQYSIACTCNMPPPPCYAYSKSEAVFVGTIKAVIEDYESSPQPKVEVEVEKNFKGMNSKTAFTYNYSNSCAWDFAKGEKFLFYANLDKENKTEFATGFCTRTQEFEDNLTDFNFLNSIKNPSPGYLIWGVITDYDNTQHYSRKPLKGIQAQILDNKKNLVGASDENGDLKISVSKEGIYKVRVFPPKVKQLDFNALSDYEENLKKLKNYNFRKTKPFVEYEIEVKENECGWFHLPLRKHEKE